MPHIPVHPSAEKRQRQNLKRREHNHAAKTRVRTLVKTAGEAITATDADAAQTKLREAIRALDKAASKGTLHRKTVSRKIGRLSAHFHRVHGPKSAATQPA